MNLAAFTALEFTMIISGAIFAYHCAEHSLFSIKIENKNEFISVNYGVFDVLVNGIAYKYINKTSNIFLF